MRIFIRRITMAVFTAVIVCLCLASCGVSKTNYHREYTKVWKEYIKSEAWKQSLIANNSNASDDFYVSNDTEGVLAEDEVITSGLSEKYESLVAKAYFKIITEAEKADARITADYRLLNDNENAVKTDKRKIQEITKRYEAHKAMLSGLKSWNVFSEDRSGDLEYFKSENEKEIQKMMSTGESDYQIVNYLIYKLADLYHIEGN
jgi:tRNA U34 5-carboxymethylaminomethyl modifying enzyme MnmG/GidA